MKKTITEDPTKTGNVVKITISQMMDFEEIFEQHFSKLKFVYECISNTEFFEQEKAVSGFLWVMSEICDKFETTCKDFEALRIKRDRKAST